jgi:hypothetical protein
MEETSNNIQRSEIYKEILAIVKLLKLEKTNDDSYDHPSIAYKLEQLFLEKLSKWISVEDKLPQEKKEVIIWYFGEYSKKDEIAIGWYEDENWYCPTAGEEELLLVTHWQPLPEESKTIEK